FSEIVTNSYRGIISHELCCPQTDHGDTSNLKSIINCTPQDRIRNMLVMKSLVARLLADFNRLYEEESEEEEFEIDKDVIFNKNHAWAIAKNADVLSQGVSLRAILGSESIDGMFDCILNCIKTWERSEMYALNESDICQAARIRLTAANPPKKKLDLQKGHPKRDAQTAGLDRPTTSLTFGSSARPK
ncbi:hypothetical protein DFH28DRAFT_825024, partial [Melampsora americana]